MARVVIPVDDDGQPSYGGRSGASGASKMAKDMRGPQRSSSSSAERMRIIMAALEKGFSINDACHAARCSRSAYQYYRDNFADWKTRVDVILAQRANALAERREDMPPFPDFCREYLDTEMNWHHLQWFDLLEGKEPRDLHPRQIYVKGEPDQFLINTPPEHAKSTTLTINYVTYRICQDPNIRILLISRTQDMAKKFLHAIKERLADNHAYAKLQSTFGPPGGFASGDSWSQQSIRVAGSDSGEHAYTVQAVGIGGQIYGTRADLAILDDCVDHTNFQQFESQISWIQNQVGTRVADAGGQTIVIGTRIESVDLYSELMKDHHYVDGESPWTYLTQPAVLEYADDPKNWVTLWPVTNRPPVSQKGRRVAEAAGWPDANGRWPMWDGVALQKKRRKMSARNWSMVYMQDQVSDDSVFKMEAVQGCIDRARYPGRLMPGQPGHRIHGMEGLYVVAGLDPAAAGFTAMVVLGLDRQTGIRWLLEVVNRRALPPHEMRAEMERLTDRYRINEWRIEKNAYQGSIVQDRLIREMLNARGCLISPHFTDSGKWDPDFGVASMASLFEGYDENRNLIRLPSQTQSEPMRNLVEQLCAWFPETKGLTDTVMALWFAEIRCRELMFTDFSTYHVEGSEFTTERDAEAQAVIDIDYALQTQGMNQGVWGGQLQGW
jgi:hypothetical protein